MSLLLLLLCSLFWLFFGWLADCFRFGERPLLSFPFLCCVCRLSRSTPPPPVFFSQPQRNPHKPGSGRTSGRLPTFSTGLYRTRVETNPLPQRLTMCRGSRLSLADVSSLKHACAYVDRRAHDHTHTHNSQQHPTTHNSQQHPTTRNNSQLTTQWL